MMIDFDKKFVDQEPPTQAELDQEQERLSNELESHLREFILTKRIALAIYFLALFVAGVIFCQEFYPLMTITKFLEIGSGVAVIVSLISMHVTSIITSLFQDPDDIRSAQAKLTPLDATDRPDECIRLGDWMNNDQTVHAYFTNLGRKPVWGEYLAADAWIKGADKRNRIAERKRRESEKFERAKQVCARISG